MITGTLVTHDACRARLPGAGWQPPRPRNRSPAGAPANPFGEPARTSTPHLTVESSISQTTAAPGSRLTVTVDVTPRRTMHVYAPGKHDYQVVGLTLDPQPWAKLEPTKYPPSEK